MSPPGDTDFDDWIAETFRDVGPFTMLFVLLSIEDTSVTPLRAAYLHVIGDETRWHDMVALFAQASLPWSGAVFFRAGREGLVADREAKARLSSLMRAMHGDRTLIKDGDFFNASGQRLVLEPLKPH